MAEGNVRLYTKIRSQRLSPGALLLSVACLEERGLSSTGRYCIPAVSLNSCVSWDTFLILSDLQLLRL